MALLIGSEALSETSSPSFPSDGIIERPGSVPVAGESAHRERGQREGGSTGGGVKIEGGWDEANLPSVDDCLHIGIH